MADIAEVRRVDGVAGKLKDECWAWRVHCEQLGLVDRIEFQEWLEATFTVRQLAIFCEMDWDHETMTKREWLHQLYLETRYGPVKYKEG